MNKIQTKQIIKSNLLAVINSCKKYNIDFNKILKEVKNERKIK